MTQTRPPLPYANPLPSLRRQWLLIVAIIVGVSILRVGGLSILSVLLFLFVGLGTDTENFSPADSETLGRLTLPADHGW